MLCLQVSEKLIENDTQLLHNDFHEMKTCKFSNGNEILNVQNAEFGEIIYNFHNTKKEHIALSENVQASFGKNIAWRKSFSLINLSENLRMELH